LVRLEIWPMISPVFIASSATEPTYDRAPHGSVVISTQFQIVEQHSSSRPRDGSILTSTSLSQTRSCTVYPQFYCFLPIYQDFTHPLLPGTSFFTPDPPDPTLSPSVVLVTPHGRAGPPSDPEAFGKANQLSHSGVGSMQPQTTKTTP